MSSRFDPPRGFGRAVASPLTRREFLRRGALGLAGAYLLPGCGGGEAAAIIGPPKPPKKVVVVGAGLSGLVAAYELVQLGHDVTVLEARDVPGGRARTIRSPFVDGQYAEAGPARIRPTDDLTLRYAQGFHLTLDPFYPTSGLWAVTGGATTSVNPIGPTQLQKIRGGTDLLPKAFADALGNRIQYGYPVAKIEQTESSVTVTTDGSGAAAPVTADRVLVTIPFSIIQRVQFEPVLSPPKLRAIVAVQYDPVTRVYLQFGRRYWEDAAKNGWGRTIWNTAIEEIWQPTWDQPGPRGIIDSYVRQQLATDLGAMTEIDRVAAQVAHFEPLFPGVATNLERSTSIVWKAEEWAGGAYATTGGVLNDCTAAEGRIHFAGEHASTNRGWMQGALESGLRAMGEIHGAAS